jgi:hypothetical protein
MRLRNYLEFQLLLLFDIVDGLKVRLVFDLGGLLEGIQLRPNTEIMLLRSKKLVMVVMAMFGLASYRRNVALFLFSHRDGETGLTMTLANGAPVQVTKPNETTGPGRLPKTKTGVAQAGEEIPVWMATRAKMPYHFQAQLGVSRV